MKILVSKFTALWLCLLCLGLNAQNVDKKEITIKILKDIDGEMTEVNKTFTDINDPELQKLLLENQIDLDIDSEELSAGDSQVKIKVKEKNGNEKKQVIIKKLGEESNIFMLDGDDKEDSDMVWIESDEKERSPKPFFGIMSGMEKRVEVIDGERTESSSSDEARMRIDKVIEGSGAEAAGLLEGDIISSVEKVDISSIDDLIVLLKDKKPGDKVKVKYLRNGKAGKTTVTLGEKPARRHGPKHYNGKRKFKDFEDMGELKEFLENQENSEGLRSFKKNLDGDMDIFYFDAENTEDLDLKIEELLDRVQNMNEPKTESLRVMVMIKDLEEGDNRALSRKANDYNALNVSDLSFFPNPSSGTFELEFSLTEKGDTDIRIVDLNGQTLYSRRLDKFSGSYKELIDISEREKGVYILEILQNNKIMQKKIVVQ